MNFYYKAEFETWKKFLLEYSAVFSRILGFKFEDENNDKIKKRIKFRSRKWKRQIVKNYLETIELSKAVTNTFKSDLFGTAVFIAVFQPINKKTPEYDEETVKEQNETINEIRKSIKQLDYAYDFYDKYDVFSESVFYDNCHVKDKANRLMAEETAELLLDRYLKRYI